MTGAQPNPDHDLQARAAELDPLEPVPDDALRELVTRDGSCMALYQHDQQPDWSGDEMTDRQLAARICADCPVQRECLELELRTSGAATLGVWGALPAEDVRALYPAWRARRDQAADQGGERS
ncbi:MAG TPA: WhiB family transcriptional regulator [Pseudonocardiaceae bacterium]|nr:WhiB family transcriptional regulator [Pseudonocardiaceae bacterium]